MEGRDIFDVLRRWGNFAEGVKEKLTGKLWANVYRLKLPNCRQENGGWEEKATGKDLMLYGYSNTLTKLKLK